MQYQIKILLLSFAITVISSFIIIPILRKLKVGQMERAEGPESHLGKQGTPTMGGIIMILVIMLLTSFMCYDYIKDEQAEVAQNIIPIAGLAVGFGLVGFIDDFKKLVLKNTKGLKPVYKIIGLLIFSVAFVLYITQILNIGTEIYIPFFKTYITLPIWLYIPFGILVLLATSNAINLTDGIDGLATSVTAIILTCLTVIGIIFDIKEIVVFGSIVIGTCLGFLLFNLNPAKIFMGDTGSLMLGGAVAGMALYLKMPLLLLIIALVPVIETISVIIQVRYFKKTGNRIFKMTPIHHHFELSGWNENKIVSVFSIITLALCIIGLIAI
ncbi:MAG: phospho-N-acetylmuramoyl-pentapeptide-transferase [Clostridia bacterium]|jgi:phospho-N-acetylmuramoyl-pentapeptide-transferase